MVEDFAPTQESKANRILGFAIPINAETLIVIVLLVIAILTRFVDLETRVMSHDESLHTYFSWQLAEGRGFAHDPLMHGPFQFHVVAFSYFLFGDSDASARFPAAFAGVLSVAMLYLFRRWLGKRGALIAMALMVVSPYLLYYGRYVRNELLVVPMALLMFYSIFRYYEDRQAHWLYLLAAALALHFTTKETAFIYALQLLLFLAVYFVYRAMQQNWDQSLHKVMFLLGTTSLAIGGGITLFSIFRERSAAGESLSGVAQPADPTAAAVAEGLAVSPVVRLAMILAVAGLLLMVSSLILAFGRRLREDFPTLDILIISSTLTIPQGAALVANLIGWDPLNYKQPFAYNRTLVVVLLLVGVCVLIGSLWDWRRWLIATGVFFGIFTIFYTTVFTNGNGFATGLVGSLGYWLEQHGVERGSQPWYYYMLVQVPVYEFLPAIGSLLGGFLLFKRGRSPATLVEDPDDPRFPVIGFLGYWALTSLFVYSFAGERMPWLTAHITLPMILFGAWAIAQLVDQVPWRKLRELGWLIPLMMLIFLAATAGALGALLGENPPFQGRELTQLNATTSFLTALAVASASLFALVRLASDWAGMELTRLSIVLVLGFLFVQTGRTAFQSSYQNYDEATEYLVYAHAATGVKTVMDQVRELSMRTTDGLAIDVGFDDDVSWPINWYMRNYSSHHYFGPNPTRELLNYPLVIVGDNNYAKVDPLLSDRFYQFDYIRMWWPMQEYWNLTWERIRNALTSPEYREALFEIWLNRDYTKYGELTGRDYSLENWQPSDRMRLYIRKDIAAMVWDYGVSPVSAEALQPIEDPYKGVMRVLSAMKIFGLEGTAPGEFARPRALAAGPGGTLFVADTNNHRIQRISPEGEVLNVWGRFADRRQGDAPGGTFNEPWGIAAAPDGSVYVADTWNHRIQRFTAEGEFLTMFGFEGQGETLDAFWGPREVAVHPDGRVFVADTGNHRIGIFSAEGAPLGSIGGSGYLPGELSEPVGVAVSKDGRVYVADTWNQRIQVFEETATGFFEVVTEWIIDGWYGQSLENKPYLDVSANGDVCTTDPEGYRVLCFDEEGEFLMGWGQYGSAESQFDILNGITFSEGDSIWVVDSGNNRLMQFDYVRPSES
jgi:uncharacterized protein (TIGR03663 family)